MRMPQFGSRYDIDPIRQHAQFGTIVSACATWPNLTTGAATGGQPSIGPPPPPASASVQRQRGRPFRKHRSQGSGTRGVTSLQHAHHRIVPPDRAGSKAAALALSNGREGNVSKLRDAVVGAAQSPAHLAVHVLQHHGVGVNVRLVEIV